MSSHVPSLPLLTHNATLARPLCVSVAVTYKTIRIGRLSRLAGSIVVLIAFMDLGLVVLGAGLWLIQRFGM